MAIDTTRLNVGSGFAPGAPGSTALLPRDQLERQAILQLVGDHPLWGLQDERQAFADLFYELKELVRGGQTGEAMASQIGTSPLVERIRLAAAAAAAAPVAPTPTAGEPVAAQEAAP